MSVVFDVLDSLNSIRNVEDLKKRWEVDSKRQQTLSYKAVDMFVSLFSGDADTLLSSQALPLKGTSKGSLSHRA